MIKDVIKKVSAEEILDSRGEPTVEVTVELQSGLAAKASVPSGASTGAFEAHELRDQDPNRYNGKGVLKAVANVNQQIDKALRDLEITSQQKIDSVMIEIDGTENKSNLGANAILGVSMAVARAASKSLGLPLYEYLGSLFGKKEYSLPIPLVNLINGGKHASTNLNMQEFWVIPTGQRTFHERLRCATEIFQVLGQLLRNDKKDTDVGNEGGYAPDFKSHKEALDYLVRAVEGAKYKLGADVFLGLDVAASEFFNADRNIYRLELEGSDFTSTEFTNYMLGLAKSYSLAAVEDPLAEEDWLSWVSLTAEMKKYDPNLRIIGDDIFATNSKRFQKGIDMGVANSILIKLNQIGTVSETLDTIRLAKKHGYKTAISHRSGETVDTFIADLAVAVGSEFIKTGSVARGERTAKYNRLLNIESEFNV